MNIEKITGLFTLFSGETDVKKYMPLINFAVCDVLPKLRKEADLTDDRLAFLCAAIANLRYMQILAQKDKLTYTYAGTVASHDNSEQKFQLARNLVHDYWLNIPDLLADNDFIFIQA